MASYQDFGFNPGTNKFPTVTSPANSVGVSVSALAAPHRGNEPKGLDTNATLLSFMSSFYGMGNHPIGLARNLYNPYGNQVGAPASSPYFSSNDFRRVVGMTSSPYDASPLTGLPTFF